MLMLRGLSAQVLLWSRCGGCASEGGRATCRSSSIWARFRQRSSETSHSSALPTSQTDELTLPRVGVVPVERLGNPNEGLARRHEERGRS